MLKSFKSKALSDFWYTNQTSKIDARLQKRIRARLTLLDAAERLDELMVPGYDFHALRGFRPLRYTIHINGPWCITFEFENGNAYRVDLEQYH